MRRLKRDLLLGKALDRLGMLGLTAASLLVAGPAHAAGSNMPWEAPLNQILQSIEGPVASSLAEPILMGGAPRSVAILNGTLAAAFGLGLRLWIAGVLLWAIGHAAAVWAAKRDPQFVDVVRRHLRIPGHLGA